MGVKAGREERERREREWKRQEQLRAIACVRQERERRRSEFLQRLIRISKEADDLRSFLARLRVQMASSPSGELARMLEWAEAKLEELQGEVSADRVAASLREDSLFPVVDEHAAEEQA